jgi:hypothetical protein
MFIPSKKYPSRYTVPLKATDQGIKINKYSKKDSVSKSLQSKGYFWNSKPSSKG